MQTAPAPNPAFDAYYAALSNFAALGVMHEQGVRSAFRGLLETSCPRREPRNKAPQRIPGVLLRLKL